MRVVFSCVQNCLSVNNINFRDGSSVFQHVDLKTAKAQEPYVTVFVHWEIQIAVRSPVCNYVTILDALCFALMLY